jgi:hypothetical protein
VKKSLLCSALLVAGLAGSRLLPALADGGAAPGVLFSMLAAACLSATGLPILAVKRLLHASERVATRCAPAAAGGRALRQGSGA